MTEKFIIPGPYGYPPVLFYLLSLFPKKFTDEYQFIFSPLFDALHNYLIFVTAYILSGNILVATSAQIIAALTPVTVLEASILNARILSYLLVSTSFISLIFYSLYGGVYLLAIAGLSLFTLFFSHKFGVQAYLFLIIAFSLVEKNPLYIVFFLSVYSLVVIIGGKRYKLIFNEQMDAFKYWYKHGNERFVHQFRQDQIAIKKRQFVDKMFVYSSKLPIVSIIGETPWIIGLFLLAIAKYFYNIPLQSSIPSLMMNKLILWVTSLTIVAFLILSIKKLRFIGEGYRYIEYVIFPLAIILASYVPYLYKAYPVLFSVVALLVCISFVVLILILQKIVILNDRNRSITDEKWEIIRYLNKNVGDKLRLGVFPLQEGDMFLYFSKGKVLTADSLYLLEKLSDIFPIVTKTMDEIVKKYKLNYIFFDRKYVTLKELRISKYKIIKDINDFVLLKV